MYIFESKLLNIYRNELYVRLEFTKFITVWLYAGEEAKANGFGMTTWWTLMWSITWTKEKQDTRFSFDHTGSSLQPWHHVYLRLFRLCFSCDVPKRVQKWIDDRNERKIMEWDEAHADEWAQQARDQYDMDDNRNLNDRDIERIIHDRETGDR